MLSTIPLHDLWLALAELFFLDTEPDHNDYRRVARLLHEAGWSEQDAIEALLLIAPIAGANLGFLIYPVIGAWAGFDKASLCEKIEARAISRQRYPKWYFYLQDKYSLWMLKELKWELLQQELCALAIPAQSISKNF